MESTVKEKIYLEACSVGTRGSGAHIYLSFTLLAPKRVTNYKTLSHNVIQL